MHSNKILVTGATGFVGQFLCRYLIEQGYFVRMAVRSQQKAEQFAKQLQFNQQQYEICIINNIDENTDWQPALTGIDAIVHLAARVHVMNETEIDPLAAFRKINVLATINLAKQAIAANVRRFIYISSVKVNGEQTDHTHSGHAYFSADDVPAPQDPYGVSKFEAEQILLKIAKESALEVVCLRPPLIYGSGVKGNFEKLLNRIKANKMIPLGKINNLRSMIYVENFCSTIELAIRHPSAVNQIYLVADNEQLSTTQLIELIGKAVKHKPKFLPIPKSILYFLAKLLGKTGALDRLFGSLVIDSSKIKNELGWRPKYTTQQAIEKEFGS